MESRSDNFQKGHDTEDLLRGQWVEPGKEERNESRVKNVKQESERESERVMSPEKFWFPWDTWVDEKNGHLVQIRRQDAYMNDPKN